MHTRMRGACWTSASPKGADVTDVPYGMTRAVRRRRRWPWVAGAFGVVVLAVAGVLLARTLQYRGDAMPGVRVLGADVSGRGGSALERRIEAIARARLSSPVRVIVGKQR